MDTKIIELRMSVQSLPTDNRQVQLAIKSEVLRLAELLDKQLSQLTQRAADLPTGSAKSSLIEADMPGIEKLSDDTASR